jgi:tetratricopeptide (TPR) repeat protein
MKLIKAKCPSCSSDLEIADNKEYYTCTYCKSVILNEDFKKDKDNLENLLDIALMANNTGNFQEAIEYCNRVLEVDINNVKALFFKSGAIFGLSYGDITKMREALAYAKKAYLLADEPDKKIIKEKLIDVMAGIDEKNYRSEHIDFLYDFFYEFGSDEIIILKKISDIVYRKMHNEWSQKIGSEELNYVIVNLLDEINKIDSDEYVLQKNKFGEIFSITDK